MKSTRHTGMKTNRMTASTGSDMALGTYLRARRASLDPAAVGLPTQRRRTPGLRREEVAQRANVSVTWYTWLEQGRGGAPSADALDRIAHALLLNEVEREHLFLLGLGRLPEVRYQAAESVAPRLQRILDALEVCPAFIKTSVWDVVAWNRAAAAVLTDYGTLPPDQRNLLRLVFGSPHVRAKQTDWHGVARFVVAGFRASVARTGATAEVAALVDDLCRQSPDFAAVWNEHDVRAQGDGSKLLHHPIAGPIALAYSAFDVQGRPDLGLVIYTPVSDDDAARVRSLLASAPSVPRASA